MTRELYLYSEILLCHYDGTLLKAIKEDDKLSESFMFYYYEDPKFLDEYFYTHLESIKSTPRTIESLSLEKNNKNYIIRDRGVFLLKETINILLKTKYVIMENFNMSLMVLCFALGCVPIFNNIDFLLKGISFGQHYAVKEIPASDKYLRMKNKVLSYYEEHISPTNTFKKLVNHLFIRDIQ